MIIQSNFLTTVLSLNTAKGITIYPFIFIKYKDDLKDKYLINHEKIHIQQQKELFCIKFYYLYFKEYFVNKKKLKNGTAAYYAISFEKEAYANEHNLNYLKDREKNSWKKYL